MALNHLTNEFVQSIIFTHFLGWITEGICLVLSVTAILVLIVILRQKRKPKLQSLLIYHNQKAKEEIQTTQQWKKAEAHIEILLYEITKNRQISDFLKEQSTCSGKQPGLKVMGHKRNEPVEENQVGHENTIGQTNQPLDVHELKDVAELAKQLQTRHQPRITK